MPLTNDELKTRARKHHGIATDHARPWRLETKQAYRFVAGQQLNDEDRAELGRLKRPVIEFNLIGPNVKAISGMERGNRHELKYLARERSEPDQQAADIYNQVAAWIYDENGNEYEESEVFRDAAIGGMGWSGMRLDFSEDPRGKIITEQIDPLKKLWDPAAKKHNLIDRRYDFTEIEIDEEQAKQLFPDFKGSFSRTVFGASVEDLDEDPIIENRPDGYEGEDDSSGLRESLRDKIKIAEYNFYALEPVYEVVFPNGNTREMNEARFAEIREEAENNGVFVLDAKETTAQFPGAIYFSQSTRKRYYKAWFTGDELIEQTENNDPNGFTDHCVTGEHDKMKNHWFGVVRAMIDPQLWSSKLFMQIMHVINTNSKGGAFVRKGAFRNLTKAKDAWAKGDELIEVDAKGAGINDAIQERGQGQYPSQLHEAMMFASGIIPRTSGFNMELLGMAGRDQPGILEQQRKQAGMTILAPFFDSLRNYRVIKGKSLIHFIREHVPPQRIARILSNEDKPKFAQVLAMPGVAKFDVVIEESPQSPNMKMQNFVMLNEMGQTNPQLMEQIFDLIVEESPLPQALAGKIAQRLEQFRQPDPAVEKAKMLALEQQQADIMETVAKAQDKFASAEARGENVDLAEMRVLLDSITGIADSAAKFAAANNSGD